MSAPMGNQFYMLRHSSGRKLIYETPAELLFACMEYFDHVDANPIIVDKSFHFKGNVIEHTIKKPRPMTISGVALYCNMNVATWATYRKREDFIAVVEQVETAIWNQKLTGASTETMNASIISQELGLASKVQLEGGERAVEVVTIDKATYLEARAKMIEQDDV